MQEFSLVGTENHICVSIQLSSGLFRSVHTMVMRVEHTHTRISWGLALCCSNPTIVHVPYLLSISLAVCISIFRSCEVLTQNANNTNSNASNFLQPASSWSPHVAYLTRFCCSLPSYGLPGHACHTPRMSAVMLLTVSCSLQPCHLWFCQTTAGIYACKLTMQLYVCVPGAVLPFAFYVEHALAFLYSANTHVLMRLLVYFAAWHVNVALLLLMVSAPTMYSKDSPFLATAINCFNWLLWRCCHICICHTLHLSVYWTEFLLVACPPHPSDSARWACGWFSLVSKSYFGINANMSIWIYMYCICGNKGKYQLYWYKIFE